MRILLQVLDDAGPIAIPMYWKRLAATDASCRCWMTRVRLRFASFKFVTHDEFELQVLDDAGPIAMKGVGATTFHMSIVAGAVAGLDTGRAKRRY